MTTQKSRIAQLILPLLLIGVVATGIGLAGTGGQAAAQQATPLDSPEAESTGTEGAHVETIRVDLVNVKVYVTDKKGEPITDLTKDDFLVLEDGRPVDITNFYQAERSRAAIAGGAPRPLVDPRHSLDAQDAPPVADPERLHLIVYVDNFNIRPQNRNAVLKDVRRFLQESIGRDDLVMLMSFDRSLHVRQPFTSDSSLVNDGLFELEKMVGGAVNRDKERRLALEQMEDSNSALEALDFARSHADAVFTEMSLPLRGLRELIDTLAGVRGRKAILYVSDGLPMVAAEDLFVAIEDRFRSSTARLESTNYDLSLQFRDLTNLANAHGVTFYTLDAKGNAAAFSVSADEGGTKQGGGRAYADAVFVANSQEPLHIMADDTGGIAITNTNAIGDGLLKVASDFETYYSLGYRPVHSIQGRYYRIEVKVPGRKGVKVRHREGYRDKTASTQLTEGALSTVYYGLEYNTLGASLEFERAERREDGKYNITAVLRVPLGALTLIPQDGIYLGRFQPSVAVMDEEGDVAPPQLQQNVTLRIPEADIENARGQFFAYELQLLVRAGSHQVAVGIHDELSGQFSFFSDGVTVGNS